MNLRNRLLALGLAVLAVPLAAEDPPPAVTQQDRSARVFLDRCAGCHTVGGGMRSGPDLLASTAWKPADLTVAVKRMEKNSGPMSDADVAGLVEFLKDSTVRDRITAEESRAALKAAATLEPASPALGREYFTGARAFRNGGASCASCHDFGGGGGSLAVPLTTVHARLGDVALASAIEQAAFPVMRPIYAAHPVTKQEAAHIVAYLAQTPAQRVADPPLGLAALGGSGLFVAALALVGSRRRQGTRARLVEEATRR